MKVLDGRNAHKVPETIEISEFIIAGKWLNGTKPIYCLQLDGKFIPCTPNEPLFACDYSTDRYKYILCAEYKTMRGFNNWLKRTYPYAIKEQ